MSLVDVATLFAMMAALAALPSASVALVVTRAATLGVANGMAVAAGIVLGDLVFVALAILGLSIVAETMGKLFMLVKVIGGISLIGLGILLWRSQGGLVANVMVMLVGTMLTAASMPTIFMEALMTYGFSGYIILCLGFGITYVSSFYCRMFKHKYICES